MLKVEFGVNFGALFEIMKISNLLWKIFWRLINELKQVLGFNEPFEKMIPLNARAFSEDLEHFVVSISSTLQAQNQPSGPPMSCWLNGYVFGKTDTSRASAWSLGLSKMTGIMSKNRKVHYFSWLKKLSSCHRTRKPPGAFCARKIPNKPQNLLKIAFSSNTLLFEPSLGTLRRYRSQTR